MAFKLDLPLTLTPPPCVGRCEIDHCNEHIGGGGGQPHTHGDSFGPGCLYSAANYSSNVSAHPPLVGLSFDGPLIYGRHLSAATLGFGVALDDCGGHAHDGLCYHYHTQVLQLTSVGGGPGGIAAGLPYPTSTVGPYKCWRANITAIAGFWYAG